MCAWVCSDGRDKERGTDVVEYVCILRVSGVSESLVAVTA